MILVLHNVNHRNRAKRLNDICFVLHVEDQHTVHYSLQKLIKGALVSREKRDMDIFYSTTEAGLSACEACGEVRRRCLVAAFKSLEKDGDELSQAAAILRFISGLYDQAARAVSSL